MYVHKILFNELAICNATVSISFFEIFIYLFYLYI